MYYRCITYVCVYSIFAPVVYIQEAAAHVRTGAATSAFIHCSDLINLLILYKYLFLLRLKMIQLNVIEHEI